ncbi:ATP-binding protein [Candidatus Roizmanbacteria bacterium CG_4_9_14_0_8_um_filter_34_12]|uniref:ATP-binding protein n=2 Tax=Candidatus Roizmaniibacteriota TaxID=1752723 RepID=A0A2M7E3H8_9BACT|nr:MAG: ATP-binding protein [Candidatus Roizmanbacteria bacterium CG01_land_8_20_14_3_00_33_9]PJB88387.1 MAG: ATP-binding protein [Candidatus Roizmanbacteria bacterium CG_4_9_14_0_8_um_filter_34_12]
MKFINRTSEISFIQKEVDASKSSFIIIYGKRRIGKTELIKESAKNRKLLYFLGRQVNNKDNLDQLSKTCSVFFNEPILIGQPFLNWDQFFSFLAVRLNKNTLIVFDEYPYFVSAQPGLSTIFQKWWDESLKKISFCKFILCGSSFGMMIEETLSEKAPLYGRRTGQIHVKPLSYYNSWKFFPNLSFSKFLEFYSVTGGNPEYLTRFSSYKNIDEAIEQEVFTTHSPLYEEIDFLLKEELREPKNYYSILKSLALNRNKISDLIEQTGIEKSSLHTYLYYLENLGLIEKEIPITEKHPEKSRKGIFRIKDQFVHFWFQFVLPFRREIEIGELNFLMKKTREDLPKIIQENYQRSATEIIIRNERVIGHIERVGRYWNNEIEIDNIGLNENRKEIYFIECKWSNKLLGGNVLKELISKSQRVDWNKGSRKEKYTLLSKSGFTQELIQKSKKDKNIILIHEDKLI